MLSAEDNELLTRTGPGTAMGDFFRRFWMPVLRSQELPETDGPPVRVRIMGEDLVAFRDTDGRVGLLDPRCPHRGANLFFGRNEEWGLRCAYHGWKYRVAGRCVDMPTMPPESTFRDRVRAGSYPTREHGEFVWAYLGPAGHEPELPGLEFALVPPAHRFVSKKLQQCNWAQACEGGIDTAHFSFLHMPVSASESERDEVMSRSSADRDRTRWMRDDAMPEFQVVSHDAGLAIGASRRADGCRHRAVPPAHAAWRARSGHGDRAARGAPGRGLRGALGQRARRPERALRGGHDRALRRSRGAGGPPARRAQVRGLTEWRPGPRV